MTELAYLDGPDAAYVRRFRARIQARPPGAVVLDRTYFYAVGGGQPADRGILRAPSGRSVDVVDVSKSGTAVLHRTRGSPEALADFAVGTEVEGVLDFERRYRHMRLHTGQHFLSARIFARAGVRTQKARLGGRGGSSIWNGRYRPIYFQSSRRTRPRSLLTPARCGSAECPEPNGTCIPRLDPLWWSSRPTSIRFA